MKEIIEQYEERLRLAMCDSNLNELEQLLSADLLFTNHLGQVMSREDDLQAHRTKAFVIDSLSLSDQHIILLDDSAVVSVQADISGTHSGNPAGGRFRFTRVWVKSSDNWQVVAGHACIIDE